MKLKNIKLLKTLAVTGALGLVAAVPVITATACSSGTSNSGGSSGGGSDTGGDSGGSSNGNTQTKVDLEVKDKVNVIGALSGIYDGTDKDTNTLIAEAIQKDPSIAFKNADIVKGQTLSVTVDAGIPEKSTWTGKEYSGDTGWAKTSSNIKSIVYDSTLKQMDISSLNNLKEQLNQTKLSEILKTSGETTDNINYTVQNKLGLSNDDIIHVNVVGTSTASGAAKATTNYDLQIPTSDINLEVNKCKISVTGNDKVNELKDATTEFTYNIGIDSTPHYTAPTTTPDLSKADSSNALKALKALGLSSDGTTLDTAKIESALNIYNCSFANATIATSSVSKSVSLNASGKEEVVAGTKTAYTITLEATPNKDGNYYWTDGTQTTKKISFDATFNITA